MTRETTRAQIERRAGERCEYCHAPQRVFNAPFHIEHIVPRSRGGADDPTNLALSCSSCNLAKGTAIDGVASDTGERARLFNPRTDHWEEHFVWSADASIILGRTVIGLVTARMLNMNARRQTMARPLWRQLGLLP